MKDILIHSTAEILQDPKVAKGIIVSGAGAATGTILDWLPAAVGIAASIMTIIVTAALLYFNWKKSNREDELHEIRMEKERSRRSTDSAPEEKKDK